jgi:hypothetical protein
MITVLFGFDDATDKARFPAETRLACIANDGKSAADFDACAEAPSFL